MQLLGLFRIAAAGSNNLPLQAAPLNELPGNQLVPLGPVEDAALKRLRLILPQCLLSPAGQPVP